MPPGDAAGEAVGDAAGDAAGDAVGDAVGDAAGDGAGDGVYCGLLMEERGGLANGRRWWRSEAATGGRPVRPRSEMNESKRLPISMLFSPKQLFNPTHVK